MDLHIVGGEPTEEEREAVDVLLGPPASGWHGGARDVDRDGRTAAGGPRQALGQRHLLLPALHAVQDRVGWVSRGALNYICRRLTVPPAEAWGVLTFYHLLGTAPRPAAVAHVCDDIACRLRGVERLCDELAQRLGPPLTGGSPAAAHDGDIGGDVGRAGTSVPVNAAGQGLTADAGAEAPALRTPAPALGTPAPALRAPAAPLSASTPELGRPDAGLRSAGTSVPAAAVGWQRSPCLGQCDAGSAALVTRAGNPAQRFVVAPVPSADTLIAALRSGAVPPTAERLFASGPQLLLARIGRSDPRSLDAYRAAGGYRALAKAIELGPERVIAEVTAARLLGRGGAAFPTGRKWDAVRRQPITPHFVVCNADESEPGTFKDRVLLEEDPFAVVEAMTICGLATGSAHGFLYIRGEYPLAEARTAEAVAAARAAGLLGSTVMGASAAFDIEIRRGAGAYICGEETALFNSIEGKRGEPRSKPPFPAEVGVFGKPTVANNVETLVNVLDVVLQGGETWAQMGTPASSGPRLFCVSGHVERPGLYEVPFGVTLRQLIELAGGVSGGRAVKAVLLGGAAGTFVTPDHLDLPLTFEAVRQAGTTLGSGVVMVFDETADVGDALHRIAEFFRHESCGQCVPCRVGTVRQQELLPALAHSSPQSATYRELSTAMRDASICGLGQTASAAIESAWKLGLISGARS